MYKFSSTLLAFAFLFFMPSSGQAQVTVDGDLSESEYERIEDTDDAGLENSALDELAFYADDANNDLYIGVKGVLEDAYGYGIWLNVTGSGAPAGLSSGSELGIATDGGLHYINGNEDGTQISFTADFEVDYALALGAEGGGTTVEAAQYTSDPPSAQQVDFVFAQDGTKESGTGPNGSTIEFAFDNSGGSDTGAELKIPFSELGASASHNIELFSFIASNLAAFTKETIPGDATQANEFSTFNSTWDSYAGGPYHTSP